MEKWIHTVCTFDDGDPHLEELGIQQEIVVDEPFSFKPSDVVNFNKNTEKDNTTIMFSCGRRFGVAIKYEEFKIIIENQ